MFAYQPFWLRRVGSVSRTSLKKTLLLHQYLKGVLITTEKDHCYKIEMTCIGNTVIKDQYL